MLRSPFVVYIAAFGSVLALYQLGWSAVYPPITSDLLLFFAVTFLAAAVMAVLTWPAAADGSYSPALLPPIVGFIVVATFAGEIVLAGGIPLVQIIGGAKFYTLEASATHLHAFVLWSVFSTIRFADFVYTRRWRYLFEASLPVIFYGLMVYRGPALICLVSWAFVFMIRHRGLRFRYWVLGGGAVLGILFVNGIIGDIRSPGQDVTVGKPSDTFVTSGVPRTYYWSYLYATVAMANLQLQVERLPPGQGSAEEFIATELIPDTLSRRIVPLLNEKVHIPGSLISRDQLYSWAQPQVSRGLNISTIFGRAYGYFGWLGAAIMFIALCAFIVFYLMLIRTSPYRVPCLALLNTLVVFCLFNNMLASAAMLPLLVLPLLLPPWGLRARPA